MPDLRYAQFCPLARAAEVLGERWTLPILRELFVGPQRFGDLRRRLPGLSSSVLATRLERLERLGVVARHTLPPPAASKVYELTASGRALRPTMLELMRWGLRFLLPPQPGDHVEPEWVRMGLTAFARATQTPALRVEVCVPGDGAPLRMLVVGGPEGTRVQEAGQPADLRVTADPIRLLALASGLLDAEQATRAGEIQIEGEASDLARFAQLFDFPFPRDGAEPEGAAPNA